MHHSLAQTGGLQVRGRCVTQESQGQPGVLRSSAPPGQLSSEAPASLLPHGAPGSWSLQPHSSLRPTSLVLLTAQMGGEGTESSFKSREETAPLLSEA